MVVGLLLVVGALALPMVARAAENFLGLSSYNRSAFDEDIRVSLRNIVSQGGFQVNFRPGVSGTVTTDFQNFPLQGAFNKLIEENGLSYEVNLETKTVTISPKGQVVGQFVTLKRVDRTRIEAARSKFGLGGELTFDDKSPVVQVRGEPEQVRRLVELIGQLEKAEDERRKAEDEDARARVQIGSDAAKSELAAAEARLKAEQADVLKLNRIEIENVDVKVIPLRYASVGPVKIKFQGEDVTVPGLIDSLKALLGINDTQQAAQDIPQTRLINPPSMVPGEGGDFGNRASAQVQINQPSVVYRREMNPFKGNISADTRTNSVVVRGTPREIAQVESLVGKLDKPLEQIEIEVMIVNAQKGLSAALGLRWGGEGLAADSRGAQIGGAFVGGGADAGGALDTTSLGGRPNSTQSVINPLALLPTSAGGSMASFIFRGTRHAITAQLDALSQDLKAEIMTSPRVVTLDNLAAKITDDRTAFVPTVAGANSSGAFLQISAGLTIKITPSVLRRDDIGEDNMVRLVIEAENTSIDFNVGGSASKRGNQVQPQVVVPDNSTFIMGGLLSDTRSEGSEGVPGLQDIPLLGELFKSRSSSHALQEVLFFITPRIVPRADLYVRDVAQKRYLQSQRSEIQRIGQDVRANSRMLELNTRALEEDE